MVEFLEWPKIPRMRREVAITEKIDGTSAAVQIRPMIDQVGSPLPIAEYPIGEQMFGLWAQSRTQFIRPEKDNYGFAKWAQAHAQELITGLGEGVHYGEWWGNGIQRGYGQTEKHFSLFNVARYQPGRDTPPDCCRVVPLLGYAEHDGIQAVLDNLATGGSVAAPGYLAPEGVVVWHSQSRQLYKILLEGDSIPKALMKKHEAVA